MEWWTGVQPWEEGLKWSKRQTGWSLALPDSICRIQTLRSPESPSHVPCASEIAADSRLRTPGDASAETPGTGFEKRIKVRARPGASRSILAFFPSSLSPSCSVVGGGSSCTHGGQRRAEGLDLAAQLTPARWDSFSSVLQLRCLRPRDGRPLAQGHTARTEQKVEPYSRSESVIQRTSHKSRDAPQDLRP